MGFDECAHFNSSVDNSIIALGSDTLQFYLFLKLLDGLVKV